MTNDQFIELIGEAARTDWAKHKILPSLTVAQAILESSWGKSGLTIKGKNLFGMKTGSSWTGKTCTMRTAEQKKDGTVYYINAPFRAYDTWLECISDHGEFLKTDRYKKVRGETNYKKACQYIKDAGYATDINYPSKLISLIEKYDLNRFDDVCSGVKLPSKINKNSSKADVKWLQKKLNKCITSKTFKDLGTDGLFGEMTQKAILTYWKQLGWNEDKASDGWTAGEKTINALSKNRTK